MNNHLLNTLEVEQTKTKEGNSLIKFLVFSIGKLTLALPVEQVKKVTKYLPLHGSGTSYVNLTHIGNREVTIIDLHEKLFKIALDRLSPDGGYFILIKSQVTSLETKNVSINSQATKESVGIRVLETPSLIDIALSNIRILPSSYRYADTLKIASHVAVIDRENQNPQTIFILDLEHII